jgi:predicted nucleic-acid-binding protein
LIGIDTNVLLRYVAQDEPAQAAVVRRFVERQLSPDRPGFVSLITLAEVLWVLARHFDATTSEQIVFVSELLDDPRFVVLRLSHPIQFGAGARKLVARTC